MQRRSPSRRSPRKVRIVARRRRKLREWLRRRSPIKMSGRYRHRGGPAPSPPPGCRPASANPATACGARRAHPSARHRRSGRKSRRHCDRHISPMTSVGGAFSRIEIAPIERGLKGVEQRRGHEHLVVERAVKSLAAQPVRESRVRRPSPRQEAVQRAQREGAAVAAPVIVQGAGGREIRGDEHRIPAGVERRVHVRRRTFLARRQQLRPRAAAGCARLRRVANPKRSATGRGIARDPENILRGVVVHLPGGPDVVVQLDDARDCSGVSTARTSSTVQVK